MITASHWLAPTSLITICINPFVDSNQEMASDLGDATFTFKIAPVFEFGMNDKYKLMQEKKESLEKD